MKIYSVNNNEKLLWETWTKLPRSEFIVKVPRNSYHLPKFFETGEYRGVNKDGAIIYYTFSFRNEEDKNLFKERLHKKDWLKTRGIHAPNYEDILKGIREGT